VVKRRIPLPLHSDTHLLLGLSVGDAVTAGSALLAALAVLRGAPATKWPVAFGVGLLGAALMVRVQEEPLWQWGLWIGAFYMTPRIYVFDDNDDDRRKDA
jgi:predicted anti-sigma-YlaC factor YlaD